MVPYDREIAGHRRKYGDSLLRKAEEHLANQRQFEAETQSRLDAARQRRQEEKERTEALEVSTYPLHVAELKSDDLFSARAWRSSASRARNWPRNED